MRIFLDASVLVAAALSPKGGSFRVISESSLRGFTPFISPYAYREAEAALEDKYQKYLPEFYHLTASVSLAADDEKREIKQFLSILDKKDAPIFAAALKANTDVLLTLDRKHFLKNLKLKERFSRPEIMTPGNFIQKYFS